MKRATWLGIWGLCLSLTVACGGGPDAEREEAADNDDDFNIAETALVEERGCLTASGDRYVLTALESGGATETELYQLVGNTDELRQHVGREVRVTGDATPARVAELRQGDTSAPMGTAGDGEVQPQVRTETQTRLETRQLRVTTITPTGDGCAAASQPAP